MPKTIKQGLTVAGIKALVKVGEPCAASDGGGLTFRIVGNSATWIQRVSIGGKQTSMGLGSYPLVGLGEARDIAQANVKTAKAGMDPRKPHTAITSPIAPVSEAVPATKSTAPMFADFAATVIPMRTQTLTNEQSVETWYTSLAKHVYPSIGHLPVDTITAKDLMAVLNPIWVTQAPTASRIRERLERIFDYAQSFELREDNPAVTVGRLLPRQRHRPKHHAALDYADLPEAIERIRADCGGAAVKLAAEFIILTAGRSSEITGARWAEIDLEAATWTVPANRMKARVEHRVPLSLRALEVLAEARALSTGDGLIFPGRFADKPIVPQSLRDLLRRAGIMNVTIHGFRSAIQDWMAEQTSTPYAIAMSVIAHGNPNKADRAYLRSDLFDKRREVMQAWADWCSSE